MPGDLNEFVPMTTKKKANNDLIMAINITFEEANKMVNRFNA